MDRTERMKQRICDIIRAHTDDFDYLALDYMADKLISDVFMPEVEEIKEINTRLEYANGEPH